MSMDKSKYGYEQIVNRLEEVIANLESENLDLDESIRLYEEGATLYQEAQKMLSEKEEKALGIIDLLEKTNPQMTIEDIKEE